MLGPLGLPSWLSRFMDEVAANGLRADFIAVHYYSSDDDIGAFKDFLEGVHAAYDRPIWVTEWALDDWSDHDRFRFEETADFLRAGALMMDRLNFVERHAWFGAYVGLGGLNLNTHLMASGHLTPAGNVFAGFAAEAQPIGKTEDKSARILEDRSACAQQ